MTRQADIGLDVTRRTVFEVLHALRAQCAPPVLPGRDDVAAAADRLAALSPAIGQHRNYDHDGRPRRILTGEHGESVAVPMRGVLHDGTPWDTGIAGDRGVHGLETGDGRTFRVGIAAGVVSVRTLDANRLERRPDGYADAMATYVRDGEDIPDRQPTREVTSWTGKSRREMIRAIGELDFSAWFATPDASTFAMVTLTAPRDWLAVFPDGKAFKRAVRAFCERLRRVGVPVVGLWKLEFQHRREDARTDRPDDDGRAPHLHLLMRVPALVAWGGDYPTRLGYGACVVSTFEDWLAFTWADVVGADDTVCLTCAGPCRCDVPDTERRRHRAAGTAVDFDTRTYADPRRIGLYFLGHSAKTTDGKEYQHTVPEAWQAPGKGPGRFWGYWGLDRVSVEADLTPADYYAVRRVLRHVARAREVRAARDRARYGNGRAFRRSHSLGAHGGNSGGWVLVNDGVRLGHDLARFLALRR